MPGPAISFGERCQHTCMANVYEEGLTIDGGRPLSASVGRGRGGGDGGLQGKAPRTAPAEEEARVYKGCSSASPHSRL